MDYYYAPNIYDPIKYPPSLDNWSYRMTTTDTRSTCDYCTNNPKNGGSGICHCIMGLNTTCSVYYITY